VPCSAGTNSLTLTMRATTGGNVALVSPPTEPSRQQTETVQLLEKRP